MLHLLLRKRSQITIFIVLIIVLFIVFIFLYYINGADTKGKIKDEVDDIIDEIFKKTAIKYYVNTCLDNVARKGLILAGEQGGIIFRNQQGSIIDGDVQYQKFEGHNVSYRIYTPHDLPPIYPCRSVNCNYNHTAKGFGFGSPEIVLRSNGRELSFEQDLCKTKERLCSCRSDLGCKYSVQAQLDNFIAYNVKECVNFSYFKEYVNVSTGNIIANVSFGNEDVDVRIDYPIVIQFKGEEPVTRFQSFYSKQPIRFKRIYEIAEKLTKEDTSNITFDIKKDGQNLISREQDYAGFLIERYDSLQYNIIIINDTFSKIDGKDYRVMYAIQNRYPALDDYDEEPLSRDFEIYNIEGDEIVIAPLAFDPDEDTLYYEYKGWKADWDDIYTSVTGFVRGNIPFLGNKWEESFIYNSGKSCVHPITKGNITNRCASYRTGRKDIGQHNLTIYVKDPEPGDYQLIRILVDDKPDITLSISNTLPFPYTEYASIEDPFIIEAKVVDVIQQGKHTYTWLLKYPDSSLKKFEDINTNRLEINPASADILSRTDYLFDSIGHHKASLEVKDERPYGARNEVTEDVNVFNCIPYRSNTPSYPLNDFGDNFKGYASDSNPFNGNHSCCSDGSYIYAHNNTIVEWGDIIRAADYPCFNTVDYGCLKDFENPISAVYDYLPGSPKNIIKTRAGPDDKADIYKRVIKRYCNGQRGNICDGPYDIELKYEIICPQSPSAEYKCNKRNKDLDTGQICCPVNPATGECIKVI